MGIADTPITADNPLPSETHEKEILFTKKTEDFRLFRIYL